MQPEAYRIKDTQTIFDVALSLYGNMEGAIDLLLLNNLDFDSKLPDTIQYQIQDNYIVRYMKGVDVTTGSEMTPIPETELEYINTGNGDSDVIVSPFFFKEYRLREDQNIFDVTLMVSGNMEDAIDLMLSNSLNFNSYLDSSITVKYTGELFMSEDVTTGGINNSNQKLNRAFSSGFSFGFA